MADSHSACAARAKESTSLQQTVYAGSGSQKQAEARLSQQRSQLSKVFCCACLRQLTRPWRLGGKAHSVHLARLGSQSTRPENEKCVKHASTTWCTARHVDGRGDLSGWSCFLGLFFSSLFLRGGGGLFCFVGPFAWFFLGKGHIPFFHKIWSIFLVFLNSLHCL